MVFGLSEQQIDAAGAHWTAREILQQPALWRRIEDLIAGDAERLRRFLAPWLARPHARIILTGAGTSAFIGQCLAPQLTRALGRSVEAIASTDIVAGPASCLIRETPTLLVSFARSGNSPESVAAIELASQGIRDCGHLIVTCNAGGALYLNASGRQDSHCILLPDESNDRSFAMTSSFTGMLLAAALGLNALPPAQDRCGYLARLAAGVLPNAAELLRTITAMDFRRAIYLGSQGLKGLACEGALKMLELTDGKVVAMADSPLGFRHGPKTIVDPQTLVVIFLGNDAHARRYDEDLAGELRRDAVASQVITLSATALSAGTGSTELILSKGLSPADVTRAGQASDLELSLPYAMFAQSLALLQSIRLGLKPDQPNAAGHVSRVVQGVTIYPWTPRE